MGSDLTDSQQRLIRSELITACVCYGCDLVCSTQHKCTLDLRMFGLTIARKRACPRCGHTYFRLSAHGLRFHWNAPIPMQRVQPTLFGLAIGTTSLQPATRIERHTGHLGSLSGLVRNSGAPAYGAFCRRSWGSYARRGTKTPAKQISEAPRELLGLLPRRATGWAPYYAAGRPCQQSVLERPETKKWLSSVSKTGGMTIAP